MELTVAQAQTDMRRGYYSGAAGILALALAIVATGAAIEASFGIACVGQHRAWRRRMQASP